MRFHVGPLPEDPSFRPLKEGWKPINEPGPYLLQFLAVPIAIA